MASDSDENWQRARALSLQQASTVQDIHFDFHGFRAWLSEKQCSIASIALLT